uniref:Uncharacterized protein n=1 Tax=Arion vulgaris TaxID=1028688 RepID=A0A0B7BQC6_9EUPU
MCGTYRHGFNVWVSAIMHKARGVNFDHKSRARDHKAVDGYVCKPFHLLTSPA